MARSIQQSIQDKINEHLQPTYLQVLDESSGHSRGLETHFSVLVVSEIFKGLGRLDRVRKVSSLLDEERAKTLHALTVKGFTPEEWEIAKDQFQFDTPSCASRKKS